MPTLSLSPSLWETVKCDFKELFPEDVFQMWFEPVVCLETTEDSMMLDYADGFLRDIYGSGPKLGSLFEIKPGKFAEAWLKWVRHHQPKSPD